MADTLTSSNTLRIGFEDDSSGTALTYVTILNPPASVTEEQIKEFGNTITNPQYLENDSFLLSKKGNRLIKTETAYTEQKTVTKLDLS